MKKIDVIDLALKIFGIHVIIVALLYLKDLHYLKTLFSQNDPFSIDILAIVFFIGGGVITFLIGYFLIFKSKKIVQRIIKDDLDINISYDVNYQKILDIALIIIGLVVLIIRLPNFITAIYRFVSYLFGNMRNTYEYLSYDIASLIHYILGYFLVTNSKAISNWIIKINKKNFNGA